MSNAPVLVTGASGFLGAQVVLALRGRAPAACVARDPERAPRELADEHWHAADLELRGVVTELVRALAPRAVIHCAALGSAAACEADPERARRLNVGVSVELAAASREAGARFVLVSTDQVFGAAAPPAGGFTEESATAPLGVYGATKREAEERVLELGGDALAVRLPLLYGDSLGRGRGATDALFAALDAGERPTLFDDEWRTPLDVSHAAAALVELALDHATTGVLHLAGPQRMTRLELGLAALAAQGIPREEALRLVRAAPRSALDLVPARAADCSLDASRARALLAVPLRSPAEALRPA
ncbi:MAG: sugar nucleotide-binding protein [Planctomycetes bacterium]|nr:sugar nucleotide-binding protein [Planctomycetota bacterium]